MIMKMIIKMIIPFAAASLTLLPIGVSKIAPFILFLILSIFGRK